MNITIVNLIRLINETKSERIILPRLMAKGVYTNEASEIQYKDNMHLHNLYTLISNTLTVIINTHLNTVILPTEKPSNATS